MAADMHNVLDCSDELCRADGCIFGALQVRTHGHELIDTTITPTLPSPIKGEGSQLAPISPPPRWGRVGWG